MKKSFAFTLAEVLITLGIIGVVAALTLPTVIANYQKQQTVTKLKKAYSILGQVMQKSVADNGAISLSVGENVNSTNVKEFFETYWLPYFNAPEIYSSADWNNNKDDNDGWQYKSLDGKPYIINVETDYNFGRIFFATQDNMTFFINIMNWQYEYDDAGNTISQTAVYSSKQLVYVDINGLKAPNIVGKDLFSFNVEFQNGKVSARFGESTLDVINRYCNKNSSGDSCAAKIMRDGWKIRNDYPW